MEKRILGKIAKNALDGNLIDAINDLIVLSRKMNSWAVGSSAEKQLDSYTALLRYVSSGASDALRNNLRDTIVAETLALTMRLSRELLFESSPEIYFTTARSLLGHGDESISTVVKAYKDEIHRLENDFESITDFHRTLKSEQLLRDIFNRIWVTHPLSADDFVAIDEMMTSDMPLYARASVISAVALGHLSYYDTKRLVWLLTKYIEYAETVPALGLRALIEAMVTFVRYRRRPLPESVKSVLAAARDLPLWNKDFSSVCIEFMRAVRTESISERMKSGFFNRLNELDQDLRDKIQNGELNIEDVVSDFNPEWADKFEKSGLGQSLREMSEIQAEGGDVFMMSFSQMKRFPFFHELANWFLPFYGSHSSVSSSDSIDGFMGVLLEKMPILCDSDKYSLILSVSGMEQKQKDQLIGALRMQAEQMAESLSEHEKASGEAYRKNIINKYVQNLYRFVNLFRSKNDVYNIFDTSVASPDLLQVKSLDGNPNDFEYYEVVAEFYFRNRFWREAADAFAKIDSVAGPDARRTQQMAYAYERAGDLERALRRYEEAEMLDGGSEWTTRRLAKILRQLGNFERASGYYKRLSDQNPDDGPIALDAAEVLLDANMTIEAEKAFQKAVYLLPDSISACGGLAWVYFLNKKLKQAQEQYDKILSLNPRWEDYECAGLVHWALGDIAGAVDLFRKYSGDKKEQLEILNADLRNFHHILSQAGGDPSLHDFIIDIIRMLISNN